jgi:hypothetical protein
VEAACRDKRVHRPTDFQLLVRTLTNSIKVRPLVETRATSNPDEVLIGMMRVLTTLVEYHPPFAEEVGLSSAHPHECGLLREVLCNGLFGSHTGVFQFPKYKTRQSRIAAYRLLVALCKHSAACRHQLLDWLMTQHAGVNFHCISSWEYHPAANDKVFYDSSSPVYLIPLLSLFLSRLSPHNNMCV